ncbi:XrtA/PEP-CTERM system-associated ATPase [Caenispirillum bisanense]|uniref:Putative secretion ATPase, PEP-CTERM locus subfamily n=1 Tax=Caenispirillum bisanense TaxID=414052 RepID=A0A286G5N6_9PROT|nr:XrtA/PEP-CTERM system-associated ATPase [Caenispirillum bisanense]SOD90867.1 putative secretion ATPase, PEP-CTERM locus subfamily [Caenispirillum bisanense]
MFVEHYGLTGHPFQLTPDPSFFFGSTVHNRVKSYLTYGIAQGEGFVIVTGDVGAGKTTLVGHLLDTLDPARFRSAKIVTSQLGADDTLRMVATAFGVQYPRDAGKAELLTILGDFLAERQRAGQRCLLVADECQNLPFEALEELRMLSNLSVEGAPALQTLLVGQPQFRTTLAGSNLEQLRQRVIASCHLGPIDATEIEGYILYRMKAVGWQRNPEFTADVFDAIHRHTGGVPRRVNVLCSRILLFGCLEDRTLIDAQAVDEVAEDMEAEGESVLDREGAARRALVPRNGNGHGHLAPAVDGDIVTLLEGLEGRLSALEERARRHDRVFRRTLTTLSEHLEDFIDGMRPRTPS